MENKKIIEIRAPHNGAVEDVNIYDVELETVERIKEDIKTRFSNKSKAEIDNFEIRKEKDSIHITIRWDNHERDYDLGKVVVEVTYGGLAYNTFQNLYALNKSLEDRLILRPLIGLPPPLIQKLNAEGFSPESDYFLSCSVRRSLMFVCGKFPLNLVTSNSTLYDKIKDFGIPDEAVLSTYPASMNALEVTNVMQYRQQNPDLRIYFNPGGTQVRIGMQEFRGIISFVNIGTMKLDEAEKFLGITAKYEGRDDLAKQCLAKFLEEGVQLTVLNDSENGSYMGHESGIYHTVPFPKEPIVRIARGNIEDMVENFSGCGDGIFSGMVYTSEMYGMNLQERLAFASGIARMISLIPESNLYCNVNPILVRMIFEISRDYADSVRKIG